MITNIKMLQNLVQPEQLVAIGEWNKQRNNLALDGVLEYDMFREEVQEYFDATELVDKLDAIDDMLFVGVGSEYKAAYNFTEAPYIVDALELVVSDFAGQCMKEGIDMTIIGALINDGLNVVIEANIAKGTEKDSNGKIVKPEGFVGPEGKLQELIDRAKEFVPPETPQVNDLFQGGPPNATA